MKDCGVQFSIDLDLMDQVEIPPDALLTIWKWIKNPSKEKKSNKKMNDEQMQGFLFIARFGQSHKQMKHIFGDSQDWSSD